MNTYMREDLHQHFGSGEHDEVVFADLKKENENLKQTFEYLKKVVEDGKEFKIDEGDEGQIVIDTKCPKCGEFWNFNGDLCLYRCFCEDICPEKTTHNKRKRLFSMSPAHII
jgi:hypothetical protein